MMILDSNLVSMHVNVPKAYYFLVARSVITTTVVARTFLASSVDNSCPWPSRVSLPRLCLEMQSPLLNNICDHMHSKASNELWALVMMNTLKNILFKIS